MNEKTNKKKNTHNIYTPRDNYFPGEIQPHAYSGHVNIYFLLIKKHSGGELRIKIYAFNVLQFFLRYINKHELNDVKDQSCK